GPLMPCFSLPWDGEMAAVDGAGCLFRFSRLKGEAKSLGSRRLSGTVHLVATGVLAVNIFDSRLVYVGREWPDNEFCIVSIGGGHVDRATTAEGKALRAFFGPSTGSAHPQYGLLALEQTEFQWLVIDAGQRKDLVKPYGAKVFGVFADERSGVGPGLLALEDDLMTVSLNGRNWRKEI